MTDQANEAQMIGPDPGNQINGQDNGVGQDTGAQLNDQAIGTQMIGPASGDTMSGQSISSEISMWCIDWTLLKQELKEKWKIKRSWKKILFIFISLLASVCDLGSDILVSNSYLNGQNYTRSVQEDHAITNNECSLTTLIITNSTLDEKIRYVCFSKL